MVGNKKLSRKFYLFCRKSITRKTTMDTFILNSIWDLKRLDKLKRQILETYIFNEFFTISNILLVSMIHKSLTQNKCIRKFQMLKFNELKCSLSIKTGLWLRYTISEILYIGGKMSTPLTRVTTIMGFQCL